MYKIIFKTELNELFVGKMGTESKVISTIKDFLVNRVHKDFNVDNCEFRTWVDDKDENKRYYDFGSRDFFFMTIKE